MRNAYKNTHPILKGFFAILTIFFLFSGFSIVWAISMPLPDINTYFEELSKSESTKIYDRTGDVQLYNMSGVVRRTQVPLDQISDFVKKGTVAIEDDQFYKHKGIEPTSIARALFVDLVNGQKKQGASTITQQVVKNTLLTSEKTWTRKIKEAVLALKLEKTMTKDQILETYLNQIPYGGNIYGVQEASNVFFKKDAKDLNLAESAYIAAIPQAPTTYSPFGTHRNLLDARKNLVLDRMVILGYISKSEAEAAKKFKVTFAENSFHGLNAPHFVFFIKDYLEKKYGGAAEVEKMGLKVYTTLDWDMQQKAEKIVKQYAAENDAKYHASNAAMVVVDPKTGQILTMVGSRDYFDMAHEGNFNVALAHRQPGSSFKPFVYATAFNQGYTPNTVLFDLPTEFNPSCQPYQSTTKPKECYMPANYDGNYAGPITLRSALAQSRNIPAVKLLYLVGIDNALTTAKKMGITSLKDKDTYGLTLVLGGGEVSLLDMTSAYGVFANEGVRHPYTGILKITDSKGKVLEEFKEEEGEEVLPANSARLVSSILSDNVARTPTYGANSALYFPGRDVAAKTGTTNDYRDTWILGYTPNLAVGAWVGNNNNSPIDKKVAGMIVAPMWAAFMREVLPALPSDKFISPDPIDSNLKPVLRGVWQGGQTIIYDRTTGQLATEATPPENRETRVASDVHSILYWVDKSNPTGPIPTKRDGQLTNWEYAIRNWASNSGIVGGTVTIPNVDTNQNSSNTSQPVVTISKPTDNSVFKEDSELQIQLNIKTGSSAIRKTEYYVNRALIKSSNGPSTQLKVNMQELTNLKDENELTVIIYDNSNNKAENTIRFRIEKE